MNSPKVVLSIWHKCINFAAFPTKTAILAKFLLGHPYLINLILNSNESKIIL